MLVASQSADLTVRNLKRVDDLWASGQAHSMADSAFGAASGYIKQNCADAGCDYLGEYAIEEDVIYGDYEITGLSAENVSAGDGYFYVPIPGRGDAAGRYEYDDDYVCDPEVPGDIDDECNWNKIYFGDSVTVPLYISGDDEFTGNELYIRVRTPLCDDDDWDCENDRKVIACKDEAKTATDTLNGCDLEDDKVILFWQIRGDREDGTDYVEAREYIIGFPVEKRDDNNDAGEDSEIYTTLINNSLSHDYSGWDFGYNENYVVVNIYDKANPDGGDKTILEILTDDDPMLYPTLVLAYIETIRNNDGAIPYLEYQVVSDVQISNDRSFITARGFVKSKGDSYFWIEEGWFSQYTSSIINFAFQN
ncbi:MAG: hypothetical protein UV80_C0009G0043 [Candidatus Peregrinibacteria bacterium GW2011_GWF2_43_17]|nr:MAG: hypothetical protein UV80_C0009G0043 [Candidatus Peregrinibacteria bacterium GW2011_GWF2_43_17]KKT20667.1 MAG: hypothetical protein UW03_C0001G0037 [Candidatus Peregrinibacteria bacterium GW2011_GWA2_43_8]